MRPEDPYHTQYLKSVNKGGVFDKQAQNITFNLDSRVGLWVKLELYFDNKWIMLSEVSFDSTDSDKTSVEVVEEDYSEVIDSYTDQVLEGDFVEGTPDSSRESEEQQTSKESGSGAAAPTSIGGSLDNPQGDSISSAASSSENSNHSGEGADRSGVEAIASNQMFIGLIIGILGVTVVLLVATILVMYRQDTHKRTFLLFTFPCLHLKNNN